MANETYLDLVNDVLVRLREDEVGAVSTNYLSKVIGKFVNDAKQMVEQAHPWASLRRTFTVATVNDDKVYSLTGAGSDPQTLLAYNNNTKTHLKQKSYTQIQAAYLNSAVDGSPYQFAIKGVDSNGDVEVEVYPTPTGVETITFRVVERKAELSLDTDTIVIPAKPVIMYAYAMAIAERGEDGGISTTEQFQIADRVLSDYIAHDASTRAGEFDWVPA